jgi:hypothetical protein
VDEETGTAFEARPRFILEPPALAGWVALAPKDKPQPNWKRPNVTDILKISIIHSFAFAGVADSNRLSI